MDVAPQHHATSSNSRVVLPTSEHSQTRCPSVYGLSQEEEPMREGEVSSSEQQQRTPQDGLSCAQKDWRPEA